GTVDVTVTTPIGGTSAASSADKFTYVLAPTVTSVTPHEGPTGGGTKVTIAGSNLTGTTEVKFGTTVATGVKVISPSSVEAVSPAGTGTVDVTVTTPGGGTSAESSADKITYVPPAPPVTKVEPPSEPPTGGTPGGGASGPT